MPRKAPSKSNIKATTFTEQNAKNEQAFQKTEEYYKAAKNLSEEIRYSAQLFERIKQSDHWSFKISDVRAIWEEYKKNDIKLSVFETVIDFIEDQSSVQYLQDKITQRLHQTRKDNKAIDDSTINIISQKTDTTKAEHEEAVLLRILAVHSRKQNSFPYKQTPKHSKDIHKDFESAFKSYMTNMKDFYTAKLCFKSATCLSLLEATLDSSYENYKESLIAAKFAPLVHFQNSYIKDVNTAYERILELDKRDEGQTNKQQVPTIKMGQNIASTFGSNQYNDPDAKKEIKQQHVTNAYLGGGWNPANWIHLNLGQNQVQQEKRDIVSDQKDSTALPVSKDIISDKKGASSSITVDSTNFADSIDESMQKGADDFYAQAKASCFNKAITEVKKYSSCLIQPKEKMGGTFGCLQYKYKADDLVNFCTETYPFATNNKIEELILTELAKAQKVEYDGNRYPRVNPWSYSSYSSPS